MISVFTVNVLMKPNWTLNADYGLIVFGMLNNYLYRYPELMLFAIIGVIGGLAGALFVKLNVRLNQWRRDTLQNNWKFGLLESFIVVSVTAIITYGIPTWAACRPLPNEPPEAIGVPQSFFCGPVSYFSILFYFTKKRDFNSSFTCLNQPNNFYRMNIMKWQIYFSFLQKIH